MTFARTTASLAALLALGGCGSIEYGDDEPYEEEVVVSSGGATVAPRTAYAEAPVAADEGAVVCSGNQRIRVHDRRVEVDQGPAIVASGNCVVEVTESIVRGDPAVIAQGNARVSLVECRVVGDIRSSGAASVDTRGTAHRGRILHGQI